MDENTGRRKLNRQQIFNTLVDNEKSNGIPLIDCKHNYRSLSRKLTLFLHLDMNNVFILPANQCKKENLHHFILRRRRECLQLLKTLIIVYVSPGTYRHV